MNFATATSATSEQLSADWPGTFRQGNNPIDEHDFYRIAGDQESASQIAQQRHKGVTVNRIGIVLALVGLGALVASVATEQRGVAAGGIALPVGGVMAYWGKLTAEKTPQISISHARESADRYNAQHASGATP
jgi:hypothetical protein